MPTKELLHGLTISSTEQYYEPLATSFHRDGYLVISQLFSPSFTAKLSHECTTTFYAVLDYLYEHGEIEFNDPVRSCSCDELSKENQYPMGQGLKNGYKELVMRSPGRYEMALLVNVADGQEQVLSAELLRGSNSQTLSNLEHLVQWIHHGIQDSDGSNISNLKDGAIQETGQLAQDYQQLQKLLHLVKTIFSDQENSTNKEDNYHLVNFSLVISTPGSETQTWHADGGHVSLTKHASCHCFNVFIPLIELPMLLGPTELRPGSHFYTRDLTKMMLGARARKELRPTVTPELAMGDALIFDYRILHRGRANLSHMGDSESFEGCTIKQTNDRNSSKNHLGKDRPILVMTFARKWFVDVCNFPKRSIFALATMNKD